MASPLALPLLLALVAADPAALRINELYVSHSGVDDREMIELVGTPGVSLAGYVLAAIEGEGAGAGTLDAAFDLGAHVVPADGYFVLGDSGVAARDLDLGAQDALENGTSTYVLVHAATPGAIAALVGTNVDPDGDGVTSLASFGTIVDAVALVEPAVFTGGDRTYDGATTVGPDGAFLPAGAFRAADFPAKWCASFLDFDDQANALAPRTPGAPNSACAIRTYGRARCPGPGGFRTDYRWTGDTTAGGVVNIDLKHGPGGAAVGFFFGTSDLETPMAGGCALLVGPPFLMILHTLPGVGAGAGVWQNSFPVPPGVAGVVVTTQAICDGGGGAFVDSNGIEIELR
ncbi:MAG: hypothetical protein ACF8XB_21610 [Planctomycetota bacterium JB042]